MLGSLFPGSHRVLGRGTGSFLAIFHTLINLGKIPFQLAERLNSRLLKADGCLVKYKQSLVSNWMWFLSINRNIVKYPKWNTVKFGINGAASVPDSAKLHSGYGPCYNNYGAA
jgi:hypothetical protein